MDNSTLLLYIFLLHVKKMCGAHVVYVLPFISTLKEIPVLCLVLAIRNDAAISDPEYWASHMLEGGSWAEQDPERGS